MWSREWFVKVWDVNIFVSRVAVSLRIPGLKKLLAPKVVGGNFAYKMFHLIWYFGKLVAGKTLSLTKGGRNWRYHGNRNMYDITSICMPSFEFNAKAIGIYYKLLWMIWLNAWNEWRRIPTWNSSCKEPSKLILRSAIEKVHTCAHKENNWAKQMSSFSDQTTRLGREGGFCSL